MQFNRSLFLKHAYIVDCVLHTYTQSMYRMHGFRCLNVASYKNTHNQTSAIIIIIINTICIFIIEIYLYLIESFVVAFYRKSTTGKKKYVFFISVLQTSSGSSCVHSLDPSVDKVLFSVNAR